MQAAKKAAPTAPELSSTMQAIYSIRKKAADRAAAIQIETSYYDFAALQKMALQNLKEDDPATYRKIMAEKR